MRIGIVGSEGAKFTALTMREAERHIDLLIEDESVTEVVSGGCHLGGIDLWAAQAGYAYGKKVTEFLPKTRRWTGGYKERNMLIAENSDEVWCITLKELPSSYTGMRFRMCYHCGTDDHVKSGGCWTLKYAKSLGKPGGLICI